ncbi:MAG: response regulator [Acidobacteriota bacterium]
MGTYRILFVDDEQNVTAALKRSLRREPYEILSASSAQEGLEILARQSIDVVVSDEKMPGMSGTEFLGLVCRRYPQTVRIMLTGQASLEAAIRAINEGEVLRFFTKPCNDTDLRVTIQQALQQRDLARQSRRLLQEYQKQGAALAELERENPGLTRLDTDGTGAIIVDEVQGNVEDLLRQIEEEIDRGLPRSR